MEKYSATFEKIEPGQFPPRIENEADLLINEKLDSDTERSSQEKENSIDRYIDSLSLSPYQRGVMRRKIELLENPDYDWTYVMKGEEKLPAEVYNNENIIDLVKGRIYGSVISGQCDESDLVQAMEFFGIEKEFFMQKDFQPYRRRKWQERIEQGDPLGKSSGSRKHALFTNEKEAEEVLKQRQKEEELAYGPFSEAIKKPEDPEIKASALKGMICNCFGRKFSSSREGLNEKATIEEYKKIFKISDKEFVEAIIEDARDHGFAVGDASELDTYPRLRKEYPLLDEFFNSSAGRAMLRKEIARRQYMEIDVGRFMKAFSLQAEDIDPKAIELDEKLLAFEDLSHSKDSYGDSYYYDINRASKYLSANDLRGFFAQPHNAERAIKALSAHCEYSWDLEKCADLALRLGFTEEQIKKVGRNGIIINCRKSYLDKGALTTLKNAFKISETEFIEALGLGIIERAEEGSDLYEIIRRAREMFAIDKFPSSPVIDKALKEVYVKKLAEERTNDVKELETHFKISWGEDNSEMRAERREAVKSSLCSESALNSFRTVSDLDKYLVEYFPETHKILWLQDKNFKQAIEEKLTDNLSYFYNSFNHLNEFVKDVAAYFNIPIISIKRRVQEKIGQGEYLNESNRKALTYFFPEIDIKSENLKYLSTHASEEIKKDFEGMRWKSLKEIQELGSVEANQAIEETLSLQKQALSNPSSSVEVVSYAIEALSELGEGIEYLNTHYYPELVNFYLRTDKNKLETLVFGKDVGYFSVLEDDIRQKVLKKIDKSSLIASPLIAFVREEDSFDLLRGVVKYASVMAGIKKALGQRLTIPDHLFKALYKRSRQGEAGEMPEKFKAAVLEHMDMTSLNTKELLTNPAIISEIAHNPDNIPSVQKMVKSFLGSPDEELLNSKWAYIYSRLKDVPEGEFKLKKNIFLRLYNIQAAWPLKDESFGRISDILLAASEEKREHYFRILELKGKQVSDFSESEWAEALMSYVSATEEDNRLELNEKSKAAVIDLFNGPYKDKALRGMQESWAQSLEDKESVDLPLDLYLVAKTIEDAGGAGNLKHVESLGDFVFLYQQLANQELTAGRTKEEIKSLLLKQEERMERERWSFDERSEMYNLSGDILKAAPSLYASFAPLLEKLSAKEMNIFAREILPLYQAQLITLQKSSNNDDIESYDPRELVEVRSALREFTDRFIETNEKGEALSAEKERLAAVVTEGFRSRFGIQKVPELFSREHVRSVQNCICYIGNINERDSEKETIIAFYLALELNGQWEAFRQGKDLKAEEYLSSEQARVMSYHLKEKKASYQLALEVAGISEDKAVRFQELLQDETMSSMIGNIQTIDIKLGNIKRNIDELADPDIYDDPADKELMKLLADKGKSVGAVLAKTYGEVSGKKLEWSEEEKEIRQRLETIFGVSAWTAEGIKKLQDRMQPFGLVTNMIRKMEEEKVEENVAELQNRLLPPEHIIKIFNNLGEEFKQESGAMALGKDISYLENLVVKDDNKLSGEEKSAVEKYLGSIKEKMKELELTLDKVREYFAKMKKSAHLERHEKLKDRLKSVEAIIESRDSSGMIISRLTKDLNLVIENMRQCLGCWRKEINNDTNLAFGDYNKFFMINQAEKEKGSISDEIVFFAPVKEGDGDNARHMSFVMDRVYGSKSPDVLLSNFQTLYKKHQLIKKEMPEARISIAITDEALMSVGLNAELFIRRLKELIPDLKLAVSEKHDLIATIPQSTFSDNYVEFGNKSAREFGDRKFSGIVAF